MGNIPTICVHYTYVAIVVLCGVLCKTVHGTFLDAHQFFLEFWVFVFSLNLLHAARIKRVFLVLVS